MIAQSILLATLLVAPATSDCSTDWPAPAATTTADADLLAALGDADDDVRAVAAMLLGRQAPADNAATTRALSRTAHDEGEPSRVRCAAVKALGQVGSGDPATRDQLMVMASDMDEDWRVRAEALHRLWSVDDGDTLRDMIGAQRLVVQTSGPAVALSGMASRHDLESLTATLTHENETIRQLAGLSLLVSAAEPMDSPVRQAQLRALEFGLVGADEEVSALLRIRRHAPAFSGAFLASLSAEECAINCIELALEVVVQAATGSSGSF